MENHLICPALLAIADAQKYGVGCNAILDMKGGSKKLWHQASPKNRLDSKQSNKTKHCSSTIENLGVGLERPCGPVFLLFTKDAWHNRADCRSLPHTHIYTRIYLCSQSLNDAQHSRHADGFSDLDVHVPVMVTTTNAKSKMGSWLGARVFSPVMYLVVNTCSLTRSPVVASPTMAHTKPICIQQNAHTCKRDLFHTRHSYENNLSATYHRTLPYKVARRQS